MYIDALVSATEMISAVLCCGSALAGAYEREKICSLHGYMLYAYKYYNSIKLMDTRQLLFCNNLAFLIHKK